MLTKNKRMGRPIKGEAAATEMVRIRLPHRIKTLWQQAAAARGLTLTDLIALGVQNLQRDKKGSYGKT